ncbi:MAG: DUF4143 domain-containing protein [Deltaproteobacteria bacterium]|nr:DUF4143 domain-containing protein [Deltaproteobacteria bacterium]
MEVSSSPVFGVKTGAYPGAVPFISDQERWRNYILSSIIEPVLGKDILGQHPVNSPALFRQTFELAVHYPAQVISFQKLLGQLQDRGNAATIKHYLTLFEQSYLLLLLKKYNGSAIQTRGSSPKIVVLNQALIHAYQTQDRIDREPGWYGHVVESVMGAHLHRVPGGELFYWREGKDEVDYVLKTPQETIAIEIKSGVRRKGKGVQAFSRRYPHIRCETWDIERCLHFLSHGTL